MNKAYEDCFNLWYQFGFGNDVQLSERSLSEWRKLKWVETALNANWIEAWMYTGSLFDIEAKSDTDVKILFNGEELCHHLDLLDQEKWKCQIKTAKRLYRHLLKKTCKHVWISNPREMNEHTTYSCIKCDLQSGFA